MLARIPFILVFALLYGGQVQAYTCKDRREGHHILPASIGKPGNLQKVVFPLLCDTVQVISGRVTEVEAGAMLAFGRPQSGNVIRVSGTLKLKGNKEAWVYLSGSIDSANGKLEPGKAPWSGLIIEPGGQLIMEYAGVWGARTPITAKSTKVSIRSSFFTGASGIIQPDGEMLDLDPTFAALNDIDFARESKPGRDGDDDSDSRAIAKDKTQKPDGLSAEEKEKLLAKPMRENFWTPSKVWGVTGLVAIAGGGAAWYLLTAPKEVENEPTRKTPKWEILPDLPQ